MQGVQEVQEVLRCASVTVDLHTNSEPQDRAFAVAPMHLHLHLLHPLHLLHLLHLLHPSHPLHLPWPVLSDIVPLTPEEARHVRCPSLRARRVVVHDRVCCRACERSGGGARSAAAHSRSRRRSPAVPARHRRASDASRRQRLADDSPHLRRLGVQSAGADHHRERGPTRTGVDARHRCVERSRGAANREQRHHVRRHAGQSGDRIRGDNRQGALALSTPAPRRRGAAASDDTRGGVVRGQGLPCRQRSCARRTGCTNGSRDLDDHGRGEQQWLLHDDGAARGGR